MDDGDCGSMMGGWGWIGALFSLIFLAAIVVGVIVLVRYFANKPSGAGSSAAGAEAILAERYARGEIDEQEYQQRLAALRARR